MSHVFKRYDTYALYENFVEVSEDAEGEWVKAQDAYDKVAALEAYIAILKAQLKDAKGAPKTHRCWWCATVIPVGTPCCKPHERL